MAAEMLYANHPIAEIFPLMAGREYDELVADIGAQGLREPIWLHDGQIVDGRNRYRACLDAGVEPRFREWDGAGSLTAFVVSLNLHRRHLDESQRAMVAARIATLEHGGDRKTDQVANWRLDLVTQREAADLLHVGKRSVERARHVLTNGTSALVSRVETGEVAVSTAAEIATLPHTEQVQVLQLPDADILRAARDIKRQRARQRVEDRTAQRAAALEADHPLAGARYRLLLGDLLDAGAGITDGSVDAIITDPPYPAEYLPLFGRLWQLAGRVLRPGGHCLVMVGQSHLPAILAPFATGAVAGLTYQWTLAYSTPGQSTQVFGRFVKSNWKPVIWLVRGRPEWEHVEDTIRSDMNDKRFHTWGQSVGGMAQLVERFTVPGALVCDPFVGGGATGVAALSLNRLFAGIDTDPAALQQSAERLQTLVEVS